MRILLIAFRHDWAGRRSTATSLHYETIGQHLKRLVLLFLSSRSNLKLGFAWVGGDRLAVRSDLLLANGERDGKY
jgi:hypothetical protein